MHRTNWRRLANVRRQVFGLSRVGSSDSRWVVVSSKFREVKTHDERSRVFLSYSQHDHAVAAEIARGLHELGADLWLDQWHAVPGEDLESQVLEAVESRDICMVLVSKASMSDAFVQQELAAAFDRRDIDVLPVVLEQAEVPTELAGRRAVSYEGRPGDLERLHERIIQGMRILDLGALQPSDFEALVGELLPRYGFDLEAGPNEPKDPNFDYVTQYEDQFGLLPPTQVLVEVKSRLANRVTINDVARIAGVIASRPGASGLIVTNSHLTSVAHAAVRDFNARGVALGVIDAPRLRQMLLEQSDLARKYAREAGDSA